jgi:4-hydroxyphenylacetate 3-monooxygenase
MSYGLLGRSPDYIASFVTGMSLKPDLFGRFADNVTRYYDFMRRNDIFAAHAIVSPAGGARPEILGEAEPLDAELPRRARGRRRRRGARHEDAGDRARSSPTRSGSGTSCRWRRRPRRVDHLCGAMQPARAVAVVAQAAEPNATSEFEAPLTWRFDETDAMVMFDDVKVPWSGSSSTTTRSSPRGLYIETPAHAYGNTSRTCATS